MVLQGFVLGLAAALAFGVADFIAAIVVRKIGGNKLLVVTHIATVGIATPYLFLGANLDAIPFLLFPVFAAVSLLLVASLVSFYKGLQLGSVAIVSPIVSAHLVIVILLSVFILGEQIGLIQMMGVGVAVGGVIAASMHVGGSYPRPYRSSKGLLFALVAMLGAGFFVFALGTLPRAVGWFLAIYLIRLITLALLLVAQKGMPNLAWRNTSVKYTLVAVLVGLLQFVGLAAYAMGTQVGSISVAAAAFSVYPIVPIIGGLVIFRERLVTRQSLGLASVLAGLVVLGISG